METLEFTAAPADAGQRLDRWLAGQAGAPSRSALQGLMEAGFVRRNGAPANKKDKLAAGDCITLPAPAGGTVSGDLYKVGGLVGVAATTEAEGKDVVLKTTGVFELDKISAQAWAIGDVIYMNGTSRMATNVSASGLFRIGVVTEVAANPSAVGRVRLDGTSVTAVA